MQLATSAVSSGENISPTHSIGALGHADYMFSISRETKAEMLRRLVRLYSLSEAVYNMSLLRPKTNGTTKEESTNR
jgi:hypothetical protein